MKWIVVLLTLFCLCQGNKLPTGAVCSKGFSRFYDRCYFISTKSETFDRANAICKALKSELATPIVCEAHYHLNVAIAHHRAKFRKSQNITEFWIGIHNNSGSTWKTTNDFEIDPNRKCQQWAPFYPSNTSGNCVTVSYKETYKNQGTWKNTDCRLQLDYVCVKCPNGFVLAPEINECLYFNAKKENWNSARETCSKLKNGAQLLIIRDQRKQDAFQRFVTPYMREGGTRCSSPEWPEAENVVWIGGQTRDPKRCDTPYVWKPWGLDEIPLTYSNWAIEQPNCIGNKEHCALITDWKVHNFQWEDNPCENIFCSVCEF